MKTAFEDCLQVTENLYLGSAMYNIFFKKMGQSRPRFVYFRHFLITISMQIEKSIDGVLGIRTRGLRMVGTDETMELWRPPNATLFFQLNPHRSF